MGELGTRGRGEVVRTAMRGADGREWEREKGSWVVMLLRDLKRAPIVKAGP